MTRGLRPPPIKKGRLQSRERLARPFQDHDGLAESGRLGSQDHDDRPALEPRLGLRLAEFGHVRYDPLHELLPDVLMGDLASPKHQGNLDLVAVAQKFLDVLQLELVIVLIGLGTKLDLFNFDHRGLASGQLLALLKLETPEIHDPAHGGGSLGSHLHQVQPGGAGSLQGLPDGLHPQLGPVIADDPDLRGPDVLIDVDPLVIGLSSLAVNTGTSTDASEFNLP